MTYIVETRFGNTWENCWTEDDKPMTFLTHEAAQSEIDDLLSEMPDYSRANYRIILASENYDLLCDDDKPNVCPHDGARTKLIALFPDSSLEQCPECRKTFNFYDDYSEA